jgi:hypothetical protein
MRRGNINRERSISAEDKGTRGGSGEIMEKKKLKNEKME